MRTSRGKRSRSKHEKKSLEGSTESRNLEFVKEGNEKKTSKLEKIERENLGYYFVT